MEKKLFVLLVPLLFLLELIISFNSVVGVVFSLVFVSAVIVIFSNRESYCEDILFFLVSLIVIRNLEVFLVLSEFWHILLVHFLLLFVLIYYLVHYRVSLKGLTKNLHIIPFVLLLGGIIGVLGNVIFEKLPFNYIYLLVLVVVSEALFFRGLLQKRMERFGDISSILFPALVYGIFSMSLGPAPAIFAFGVSLVSGIVYWSSRNVLLCILLNLVISGFLFIIPSIL